MNQNRTVECDECGARGTLREMWTYEEVGQPRRILCDECVKD